MPNKNSPVIGDNGLKVEPGYNSKIAGHILEIMQWEKVDRNDIQGLQNRIEKYIDYCLQNDIKIGNMGMYTAMGIDRKTAHDWEHGVYGTPEHSNTIKKAKAICAMYRESLMSDGKINPITGIFWQKNFDGFRDIQEHTINTQPQDIVLSHDEIVSDFLPEHIET